AEKALAAFRQVERKYGGRPRTSLGIARCLMQLGHYTEAVDSLRPVGEPTRELLTQAKRMRAVQLAAARFAKAGSSVSRIARFRKSGRDYWAALCTNRKTLGDNWPYVEVSEPVILLLSSDFELVG